jgi:hypothetical protein
MRDILKNLCASVNTHLSLTTQKFAILMDLRRNFISTSSGF